MITRYAEPAMALNKHGPRTGVQALAPLRGRRLSDCAVLLDFDNTMTRFDVLDRLITRFAIDDGWVALERAWQAGRIGSRDCLEGQLRSVRVTRERLRRFLSGIKLDPACKRFVAFLRRQDIEPVIVSDNFAPVIRAILRRNGLGELRVYANRARLNRERLVPSFPYHTRCPRGCAHCKTPHVLRRAKQGKLVIYIGDGLSDVCPASVADVVFAKGALLRQLRKTRTPCAAFEDLGDVHRCLKDLTL